MRSERLVFEAGMADTRAALRRWRGAPGPVLARWAGVSLLIALGMLVAVSVVAQSTTPDPGFYEVPGITRAATGADLAHVLARNGLVLALHALACVAGFMAGSSLPRLAASKRGISRWVHEKAGPLAIAFVGVATFFSLATQTLALGHGAAALAAQFDVGPATLLRALALHALPELTALFLPLAAWLLASRRGAWDELLAATAVTVAIAVPVLVASAFVEVYVTPGVVTRL